MTASSPAPGSHTSSFPSRLAQFCDGRWFWPAVFAVFFVTRTLYAAKIGVVLSPDSQLYSVWADQLVTLRFNYLTFLRGSASAFPPVLYIGFITLVALIKVVFGAHWAMALVGVNVLAQSALGVLIVWLVRRLSDDRRAMLTAAMLYLVAFDIAFWTPYALSDSIALLLFFGAFVLLALAVAHGEESRPAMKLWWTACALLLASMFFRPTGILLLPLLPLAMWMSRSQHAPRTTPIFIGASGAALAIITAHSWLMQNPERWPLHALGSVVRLNASRYRIGEVMWDRPETAHAPPQTLVDFILIALDRSAHFFYFLHRDFSFSHNALNALFFAPLYALAAWTLWRLTRGGKGWNLARHKILWLSLASIYTTALFHSMVQVDYDWRYRLPILPHLIFIAAFAFSRPSPHKNREHGALSPAQSRPERP